MADFTDNLPPIDAAARDRFMKIALAEAALAEAESEVPVGAVLIDATGSVLARGHNRVIAAADPTAHAEIQVLRKAARLKGNYRLPGATLFVTVEPCLMCMGALIHARVARIFYGTEDPKWGGAGSICDLSADPRLNHRIEVIAGVMREDCRDRIRDFFRKRRKSVARTVDMT